MARLIGECWRRTGYFVTPRTATAVMANLGEIGVYSNEQSFAWRGMSSADYPLISSLHRELGLDTDEESFRAVELDRLAQAREWGLGVGRFGKVDDLQLLADLQHYGIATRLIDFTSNPMTALWFACQTPRARNASTNGIVLALNVTDWPVHTSGDVPLTWTNVYTTWQNKLEVALGHGPFLVRAVEPNARIAAQEGFFATGPVPDSVAESNAFQSLAVPYRALEHGNLSLRKHGGEGSPSPLPFVAVVIRSELKAELLRHLSGTYNRSARVLFPDYAGFREFGSPSGSKEPSEAIERVQGDIE